MASTIKGCFYDGSVTFCYFTLLSLPPNKTSKLWMKICGNDRWEKVVSLEFYHLEWKQNFSMMCQFFLFPNFLWAGGGNAGSRWSCSQSPRFPALWVFCTDLVAVQKLHKNQLFKWWNFFLLFGLGQDLDSSMQLIYILQLTYISFGSGHFILTQWF